MPSIAFACAKGGVGKTTLAVNFSIALTLFGKRALLVDADLAGANVSVFLGVGKSKKAPMTTPITLHEVLMGEASPKEAIYEAHGLKFVPSSLALESFLKVTPERLREAIREYSRAFDYVIVDTAPGLGKITRTSLKAVDGVIIVTTPDLAALAGALKTRVMADKLGLNIEGVLVNMYDRFKGAKRKEIEVALEARILGYLPFEPKVQVCCLKGEPIVLKYKNVKFSQELMKACADFLGVEYKVRRVSFLRRLREILKRKR